MLKKEKPNQNKTDGSAISPDQVLVLGFFFFNTLFLPIGLLYTTILTPLFLGDLLFKRKFKILAAYAVLSSLLGLFYWFNGVDGGAYLRSYMLFTSIFIFVVWIYFFLENHHRRLSRYFNIIVPYNFLFTLLALVILFIPGMNTVMWHMDPIHPAIPVIPRLKLFVYEPSFYSLQLAPIFLYYFWAYLFSKQGYLLGLILISFSLLLSLSFGILGGLVLAILIVYMLYAVSLLKYPKPLLFLAIMVVIAISAFFLTAHFFPDNPVLVRLEKVLEGDDTSANGRTWEAFLLAWKILEQTSYLLGAGLGQVKIIGHEIIVDYYNYYGEWTNTVRLPNAMAETLATFGILGAAIRIFIQIGLFFLTRGFSNYYRACLFTFLFIYQFTGSFLTNVFEYLLWVMVFLPIFPNFDRQAFKEKG